MVDPWIEKYDNYNLFLMNLFIFTSQCLFHTSREPVCG